MTAQNLLVAFGIALRTGSGYMCSIPSTVWVDVAMPYLIVTSPCLDQYGHNFTGKVCEAPPRLTPSGLFASDHNDPNGVFVFTRDDGFYNYQQVAFQRLTQISNLFNLVLLGVNSIVQATSQATFDDWAQVQYNVTYAMTPNCNVSFEVLSQTPVLQPPPLRDASNYYLNTWPPATQWTRACNWHVGCYTPSNTLCYDHCGDGKCVSLPPANASGDACGGDVLFRTPGIPGTPIFVPSNLLYVLPTCADMYPPSITFKTYAITGNDGPLMNVDGGYICNAPFIAPQLVNASSSLVERYKQCFMLGGTTAGLTQAYCQRDAGIRLCLQVS